jgi:uncharacterized protein (TIGR03435 family)
MKRDEENVEELLRNSLPSVSTEHAEDVGARVLDRLQSSTARSPKRSFANFTPPSRVVSWRGPALITAAAAIVLAVILPARVVQSAPAVLEDASGSRKIQYGELVRPSGDMSAMLSLADGPRVETRSMSEFVLERANDGGTRIKLNAGGLIVDAASQHNASLYVQTKDITALVSGAVSLVNAEEEGSRVAALGGEVRVQQGTTERKLRAGEQVASSSRMGSLSLKEEVAWSREAETHVALLQQAPTPTTTRQRLAFEVASIRPSNSAPSVGGRGGGATNNGCGNPPAPQIDPSRFYISNMTLFNLVGQAYPARANATGGCLGAILTNVLSGGPDWVKSVMWDIEARIPEGSPSYTRQQFMRGEAPELHEMLQSLLADRFKLKLRRETRERPVYLLTVMKGGPRFSESVSKSQEEIDSRAVFNIGGKIMTAAEFKEYNKTLPSPARGVFTVRPADDQNGNGFTRISVGKMSMSDWAEELFAMVDRPVLDRTGLSGRFEFHLEYDKNGLTRPPLIRAHEEQIGLKLEPATAPVEVWVIENAEKPSEN